MKSRIVIKPPTVENDKITITLKIQYSLEFKLSISKE